MASKKKRENLKYTLDKLYRCRDLEISNLWQRSVFLSVFLILCFTAYGYLAFEIVKSDMSELIIILRYSLVCMFIANIGIIFSIIWVLMGKGSKAWYEVYENAIREFEIQHSQDIGLPIVNIMGNMAFPPNQKNDNIFTTKGGAYSPSKINIAIGQISLFLWLMILIIHVLFNFL